MIRAADVGVRRSLTAGLASSLKEMFVVSAIKPFLALLRKVAMEQGRKVPDTEARQLFGKSGYLMERYFPAVRDVAFGSGSIKKQVEYEKKNSERV